MTPRFLVSGAAPKMAIGDEAAFVMHPGSKARASTFRPAKAAVSRVFGVFAANGEPPPRVSLRKMRAFCISRFRKRRNSRFRPRTRAFRQFLKLVRLLPMTRQITGSSMNIATVSEPHQKAELGRQFQVVRPAGPLGKRCRLRPQGMGARAAARRGIRAFVSPACFFAVL